MPRHYAITERQILEAVKLFRWVTRMLLTMYFGGVVKRIKALEVLLPKLEREEKIVAVWHKGEKVYSTPRENKVLPVSLDHEIACADILIRLWRCRMEESEIFSERVFRGNSIVPEGGLRYSKKRQTMLIFEFCTEMNFSHGGVMKSKLTRYKKHLPNMEAKVQRVITVLFVIGINRARVKDFVVRVRKMLDEPVISTLTGEARYPFFFTDYQTFKNVPVGKALTEKIYFWHDANEWRLTNDA